MKRVPIGVSDFRELREGDFAYVDKSLLVPEVLDRGAKVLLLPRPRRFGKTLNLSMLRCFFEKRAEDFSHLFRGLAVDRAGEAYRAHFQRYPTIVITFRDVKAPTWEQAWGAIRRKIRALFDEHRALLDDGALGEVDATSFRSVLDGTAEVDAYGTALFDLSRLLERRYGQPVVILIDEYDEPIHAAFMGGYDREALAFFRTFLTAGLKDNPHLFKAVLTGVLRIARESIFSGLNNLAVYSLLRPEFSACFGFTGPEVQALLDDAGRPDLLDAVRRFYNGYVFGGVRAYNPWSILNFLASDDKLLRPYWVGTSANDLIRELLQHHALSLEEQMDTLLQGGQVERRLDENVVLADLRDRDDALWSLLVFSGYLTAEAGVGVPGEEPPYLLAIPNREVREVYTTTFRQWMADRLRAQGGSLDRLTRALLRGDAEGVEAQIQAFATNLLSVHDRPHDRPHDRLTVSPEQVYQAFVLGLCAALEPDWQVRSNRESGTGRPDVMIRPAVAGKPGVVLELKVARAGKKTIEQALAEGMAQIEAKDYGAELRAAGASVVWGYAVAFDGKVVRVKGGRG